MSVDPLITQLRERRHQRRVKPYVLADLSGVCFQAVYKVESGERDPRLSTLRRLADALGCDIALVPRTTDRLFPAAEGGTQPERKAA